MNLSEYSNRTERIQLRVTPQEKEKIQMLAAQNGQSVTDFILDHCLNEYSDYDSYRLALAAESALSELHRFINNKRRLIP